MQGSKKAVVMAVAAAAAVAGVGLVAYNKKRNKSGSASSSTDDADAAEEESEPPLRVSNKELMTIDESKEELFETPTKTNRSEHLDTSSKQGGRQSPTSVTFTSPHDIAVVVRV